MATQVGNVVFQISADLKNIQGQLRTLEGNFNTSVNRIQGFAAGIAKGLVAGFSVTAITNFAKNVADTAGRLQDLSEQTGVSSQLLSGLKSTLEESGSSVDSFARSVFMAQKNLGAIRSDTEEAARAAADLGLDYKELITLSPEQFFDKIAVALAKVENVQQRNALGAKLLGRSYQEMSAIIPQVAGRLEEFRDQGISEADIATLDRFGDAWTRIGNKIQIATAGFLADAIEKLEAIKRLIDLTLSGLSRAEGAAGAFVGGVGTGGLQVGGAASPLEGAIKPPSSGGGLIGSGTSDAQKAAESAKKAADAFITSLQKQTDQLRVNLQEQRLGADAARRLGLEFEFAALKAKLLAEGKAVPAGTEQKFDALVSQIQSLSEELNKAKVEADRLADAVSADDLDRSAWLTFSQDVENLIIAPVRKARDEWEAFRTDQIGAAFDLDSSAWATFAEDVDNLILRPAEEAKERAAQAFNFGGAISGGIRETLIGIQRGEQELSEGMKNMLRNVLLSINEEILNKTILTPLTNFVDGFFEGLLGTFEDRSKEIGKQLGVALQNLLNEVVSGLSGPSGGGGGGGLGGFIGLIGSMIGGLFGGAADNGLVVPGPVGAPKLVMAHAGETILPTHKSLASTFTASGGARPPINLNVVNQIMGTVMTPSERKSEIVNTMIQDADNRGGHIQMVEQRTVIKGAG